jgi:FtsP/CotA-like multicopper oxidase with cupredoxin domain
MRELMSRMRLVSLALLLLPVFPAAAHASFCYRPAQGSMITQPPDLYSENGVLRVTLNYYTRLDNWGHTLFCYQTPDGKEAPTLHLNPGDKLKLTLTNKEPGDPEALGSSLEQVSGDSVVCGDANMTDQSVNLHFHGMNVSPNCHSDDVVRTLVNPGESFDYTIKIPKNEPPGMYWYHQHVHGISSHALQGGASGAIEVEGIANIQPAVAGLPQRFLVIRDQPLTNIHNNQDEPFWDISLNYVPVIYPQTIPGVIKMKAGAQEFWRVVNSCADTTMDLQVLYDGQAQPLQIAAFDGVPTGSQDGRHQGTLVTQTDILVPPAGRVEFIVTGPTKNVKNALFWTDRINTGPAGDNDTARPLARIRLTDDPRQIPKAILPIPGPVPGDRFAGLDDSMVTAHRKIFFDEHIGATKNNPSGGTLFYVTVVGQPEQLYNPNNPPEVTTHVGAVEDWTIENHTAEIHMFHIHQIHFQVLSVNGVDIPKDQRQFYDMYQVPYDLNGADIPPYPNIKVRIDFRGNNIAGEFVFHCHILDHEDAGMMANIMLLPHTPPPKQAKANLTHQARRTGTGTTHA